MRRQLYLLVPPLRSAVVTGNDARPMDSTEVPVDERVSGFCLVRRTLREPEVPFGVFGPRVGLQEGILICGSRLRVTPFAVEDVLATLDELAGACEGTFVDHV